MTDNSTIIFGCGGHARSVADIILYNSPNAQLTFVDENAKMNEKIWGFNVLRNYIVEKNPFFIAIGDNYKRKEKFEKFDSQNAFNVISKLAYVSKCVNIGKGCFVGNFCHIGPEVIINNNIIINTSSIIEHEVKIGNHCNIGPNAVISGKTTIEDLVFIGVGATVVDKIKICSQVVIGAGATVVRDIEEPGIYIGIPAKKITKKL